ncbi:MAG: universal stress protein [Pseudomonadota bacterium]
MSERTTLLAVLELNSNPDRLVERAIWLARAFDCSIHLMMFEPETTLVSKLFSASSNEDLLRDEVHRAQASIVAKYAETVSNSGIDVETSILRSRPLADYVLEKANELQPRIVVKATRYHSIAERSILVDADWQLMRTCSFPLWFVKSETLPDAPLIAAAVDPGHAHDKPASLDNEIITAAKSVAAVTGGDIHLVHAYESIGDLGAAATWAVKVQRLPVEEIDSQITDMHNAALVSLAEQHDINVEHTHMLPGRAQAVLPAFVHSQHANIFVMGALSRWGVKRALIGSTAEHIIDHLPCDTLIVRVGEYPLDL